MERPLDGIKVLEWGIFHAGPGASAILGDLGAEIVKIEQRGVGDPVRRRDRYGHTHLDLPGGSNLFFEGANRNKKSIALDLSQDKGKRLVYRLVPHFDVFVTNIRRRTVEKMNMTYSTLSAINPSLIYVSVSCYGPEGPDRDSGGFDFQGQARAGIMYSVGRDGWPPLALHFAIVDQGAAIVTSQATLAALVQRQRTGRGQHVETSVLGSALYLAYFNYLYGLWFRKDMLRHDRADTDPARNYYQGADGEWLMLTLMTDADWVRFCRAIGRPDLAEDPRFSTEDSRVEVAPVEVISTLDSVFATRSRDEWLALLKEHDIFACAVNRTSVLESDPQIRANYLDEIHHPNLGRVPIPGFPARFSNAQAGTRKTAPKLGEDTDQVLRDLLGCTPEELEELRSEGVIE